MATAAAVTSNDLDEQLRRMSLSVRDRMDSVSELTKGGIREFGRCGSCAGLIVGDGSGCVYKNKTYHRGCMACAVCHCDLGDSKDIFEDGNRKFLCRKHAEQNSLPTCTACAEPVEDRIIDACGGRFHVKCFTCVTCKKELEGSLFTEHESQAFCMECWTAKQRASAAKCHACSEPVVSQALKVSGERIFHPACFSCHDCSTNLEGRPFVTSNDDYLCTACYHNRTALTCNRCTKKILPAPGETASPKFYRLGEQAFHMDCFTCFTCNAPFKEDKASGPYRLGMGFYCQEHASERMLTASVPVAEAPPTVASPTLSDYDNGCYNGQQPVYASLEATAADRQTAAERDASAEPASLYATSSTPTPTPSLHLPCDDVAATLALHAEVAPPPPPAQPSPKRAVRTSSFGSDSLGGRSSASYGTPEDVKDAIRMARMRERHARHRESLASVASTGLTDPDEARPVYSPMSLQSNGSSDDNGSGYACPDFPPIPPALLNSDEGGVMDLEESHGPEYEEVDDEPYHETASIASTSASSPAPPPRKWGYAKAPPRHAHHHAAAGICAVSAPAPLPTGGPPISEWLMALGLGQYAASFIDNAFTSWESLHDVTLQDLKSIGIADGEHRKLIYNAVRRMSQSHAALQAAGEAEDDGDDLSKSPTPVPEDNGPDAVARRMAELEARLLRAEEQAQLAERRAIAAEQQLGVSLKEGGAVVVRPAARSGEAPLGRMAASAAAAAVGGETGTSARGGGNSSPLAGRPQSAGDVPPPQKPPRSGTLGRKQKL